jgi:hypothetical protein
MKALQDYIAIDDGVFKASECQKLIGIFEGSMDKQRVKGQLPEKSWAVDYNRMWLEDCHFANLELSLSNILRTIAIRVDLYLSTRKVELYNPRAFTTVALKRYDVGGRFDRHIDQADFETSSRILAVLVYLNSINSGHTVFPDLELQVKPETGRMLIFPPTLTYPHYGAEVETDQKYILQTYLVHQSKW